MSDDICGYTEEQWNKLHSRRQLLEVELYNLEESCTILDGFDSCIIGLDAKADSFKAVYSMTAMVHCCIEEMGMTAEDSIEHLNFNVLGSLQEGERWPIVVHDMPWLESEARWHEENED